VNFRNLDVYQVAVRFLPLAANIADSLPPRYAGLADQLHRASLSIPLNIAEGSGKSTGPDQRRFYTIARQCDGMRRNPGCLHRFGAHRTAPSRGSRSTSSLSR